ncbi:MAG: hypothetical protein GY778_29625 [bacterium]|nr:hypothetical protein [bacterium]
MLRDRRRLIGLLMICGISAGCGEPTERLNAPPQGQGAHRNEMQAFYAYMTDNATMSDSSLADIHFVPHTTELNSLGTARLTRMAQIMETYGGTVRYETRLTDEEMVDQRLVHVRDYLATTGIDLDRVEVLVAMAGSAYVDSEEAFDATKRGLTAGREDTSGGGESR